MPPYCPISTHTFTTPTHPNLPSHTSTPSTTPDSFWPTFATIAAHTFLSRIHFLCLKVLAPSMNNILATKTRANRSLSHEPPPPPSLQAQQASQAIHSSPPALSPPLPPPSALPHPRTPTILHKSGAPLSNARGTSTMAFPLHALQVVFRNVVALGTLK